ncbi:hypothetical protein Btru_048759 [Bulinus truncatus]|nr:hypothetical protein Btru_048759 [Bulinus truncatus]
MFTLFNAVQNFRLDVNPSYVKPGITDTLVLNCFLPSKDLYQMKLLNSMVLSRLLDGSHQYDDVVAIGINNGTVNIFNKYGRGTGAINNEHESFLSYQVIFPFQHVAGEYKCEANGIDATWRPRTLTAKANVVVEKVTLNSVCEQLRNLHIENTLIKRVLENQQRLLSKLLEAKGQKDRLSCSAVEQCVDYNLIITSVSKMITEDDSQHNESCRTILEYFHESPQFEKSRYYLHKQRSDTFNVTDAEETCDSFGGHLAVIEDDLELEFVRNFIRTFNFEGVYITGSDERVEGTWVNPFNDSPLKFLRWGGNDPDGNTYQNCISLWKSFDYLMIDAQCTGLINGSYLCEISQ